MQYIEYTDSFSIHNIFEYVKNRTLKFIQLKTRRESVGDQLKITLNLILLKNWSIQKQY